MPWRATVSIFDLGNGIILLIAGSFATLAQTDTATALGSSLIQFGAIGVILAWITLVDIPARNKAAEKREEAWKEQLVVERQASKEREASFQASLERLALALERVGTGSSDLATAVKHLGARIPEECQYQAKRNTQG